MKVNDLTFKKATETSEDLGPTSFYVDGKNKIYILDSSVRKIKVFLNNNFIKTIPLDTPYYPQDILLHGNEIYLLTNTTIEKLDKDGNTLIRRVIVGKNAPLGNSTGRMFLINNKLLISSSLGDVEKYISVGIKELTVDISRNADETYKGYLIADIIGDGYAYVNASGNITIKSNKTEKYSFNDQMPNNTMYQTYSDIRIIGNKLYKMIISKSGLKILRCELRTAP